MWLPIIRSDPAEGLCLVATLTMQSRLEKDDVGPGKKGPGLRGVAGMVRGHT